MQPPLGSIYEKIYTVILNLYGHRCHVSIDQVKAGSKYDIDTNKGQYQLRVAFDKTQPREADGDDEAEKEPGVGEAMAPGLNPCHFNIVF